MVDTNFLVNEKQPIQNEFFRVKEIFDRIAQNKQHEDVVKLKILADEARELYKYMGKIGIQVNTITGWKYITGAMYPQEEQMTISETMKEADRCFSVFHDYETAKNNYRTIVRAYQLRLEQYRVYDPFFENTMILISRLEPRLNEILEGEKKELDLQKMTDELDFALKEKIRLEDDVKKLQNELRNTTEAWELSMNEQLTDLAEQFNKILLLRRIAEWKGLTPEQSGQAVKIIAYMIGKKANKIKIESAVKLGIENFTVFAELPFVEVKEQWFIVDFAKMKEYLDKEMQSKDEVTSQPWIVEVKHAVNKYFEKIKGLARK